MVTSPLLTYRNSTLWIGSRSLEEIVQAEKTPFFLLSETRLRTNYDALIKGLSTATGRPPVIRYCAKTNHEPAVLKRMAEWGAHCLVSHGAEADQALQHGFNPERLAYQRPLLLPDEIVALCKSGVNHVHLFRKMDLDCLERVALEMGTTINVSLRLKPPASFVNLSPVRWLAARLGFDGPESLSMAERVQKSAHLRLKALNVYIGTQQGSMAGFRRAARQLVSTAAQLWQWLGVRVDEINLGGGIPSSSLGTRWKHRSLVNDRLENALAIVNQAPDELEARAKQLGGIVVEEVQRAGLDWMPALAIEPGRSLVGNAGMLVTGVRAVQGRWLFLDASQNYLGESPLVVERLMLPVRRAAGNTQTRYHLSGSTLNTMDVIDVWRRLPVMTVGDHVVICDAGAYSIGRACRYGSLLPAVYLINEEGGLEPVRRAEHVEP